VRKTILGDDDHVPTRPSTEWFCIEATAGIGVTSEDADAPVENVVHADHKGGWRAGGPGPGTFQITFRRPTNIRRIQPAFRESRLARMQELSCSEPSLEGNRER
jgi:hypothetical protein